MFRAAWRSLLAHKGRLLLSTIAVAAGIAFLAGTYVFTDTLKKTFEDLFNQVVPDVVVQPEQEFAADSAISSATLPVEAEDIVASVDGVQSAQGSVFTGGVVLLDDEGDVVGTPGAPTFGASWSDDETLTPLRLVEGRGPTSDTEVAIDTQAQESGGFEIGDTLSIATPGPAVEATLVGVFRFGSSGNLAGATITAFEVGYAQDLLLGGPAWNQVDALAESGVSQDTLAADVEAVLADAGLSATVQTGEEYQDEQSAALTEGLGFINTFLLVFALVAIVVAIFVILNTFSILVARRSRELALLRALGASKGQVTRSVLGEAVVVGLIGSVLGLLAGLGLALGLQQVFRLIGADIPAGGLVVLPRTVILAITVGLVVTVAAALYPAVRAGRVPPLAAMRDDITSPRRAMTVRAAVGVVLLLLGAGLLAVGLVGDVPNGIALVGAGALVLFVAVAVLAAVIARPVVGILGWPVRASGTVGRLAVRNAQRDRRRTAATSSALMIGLALVSAIGVLGASTTASLDETIDDVIGADYVLFSTTFQPFSSEVAAEVAEIDGVQTVARTTDAPAQVDGTEGFVSIVDPDTYSEVINEPIVAGSYDALADGELLQLDAAAEAAGREIGDSVEIIWPTGRQTYLLGGTYEGVTGGEQGFALSREEYLDAGNPDVDSTVFVTVEEGVDPESVREELDAAAAPFGTVNVQDQTEFKDQIRGQVNQLLTVIYALLALAVVIAILGIVNTLALSVLERTREIGLLRAVGTTRTQLRRMVMWESVVIALFGAVLGVALGLALGAAVRASLAEDGISVFAVPVTLVVTVLVLSAIVGVLAALAPARRASKMNVLDAIATE